MWADLIDPSTGAFIANKPPALFGVFPIYGILLLAGFAFSFIWAYVDWNKKGYRTWDFIQVSLFTTMISLYGAKIWYMVFDPLNAFGDINGLLDLLTVIFIPAFGRSIIGSIVFAPVGIYIYKRIWGPDLNTLKMIDIFMPALLIGIGIGRWGNFANHQVYGQIVSEDSLNWLPNWIKDNMYIIDADKVVGYRNPLFLYESFADFATLMLIVIIFKINVYWKDGVAGFAMMGLYGFSRACTELLRDKSFIMHWGTFPTSFVLALLLFISAISIIIFIQYKDSIVKKINS